jgi:hypothetical protein
MTKSPKRCARSLPVANLALIQGGFNQAETLSMSAFNQAETLSIAPKKL